MPLINKLVGIWNSVLPDATPRSMANVLWACGKLRHTKEQLWSSTVAELMDRLQQPSDAVCQTLSNTVYGLAMVAGANKGAVSGLTRDTTVEVVVQLCSKVRIFVTHPLLEGVDPPHVSNSLWGCAKLRINPGDAVLNSILQAAAKPALLQTMIAQHMSNILWAVSELQQECGWQPQEQQRVWQRLLSQEHLTRVLAQAEPQHVSNIVFALARVASSSAPVVSQEVARDCVQQLLHRAVANRLELWNGQDVGNATWACAKLGMTAQSFFDAVEVSAPAWLRQAAAPALNQVAYACGTLHVQRPQLMMQVMRRAHFLMSAPGGGKGALARLSAMNVVRTPATLGWAVAELNMQQLAGDLKELVASSVQQSNRLTAADARMLGAAHAWMVQQQLLDGQGLSQVLTAAQLAACTTFVTAAEHAAPL